MPNLADPSESGKNNEAILIAILYEQGHSPDEIKELLPALKRLGEWTAPNASQSYLQSVVAKLSPLLSVPVVEIPIPGQPTNTSIQTQRNINIWGKLSNISQLLRAQIPLIRREIWLASCFVLFLGWLVSVFLSRTVTGAPNAVLFAFSAPLIAALGLSLIYGPENDVGFELALTTNTSPRQVLLCRFVLVFGYNLLLTLILSGAFKLLVAPIDFFDLLGMWIGPMFLLSGFALLLSQVFSSDRAIQISLILWALRVAALTSPEHWIQDWAGLWANTLVQTASSLVLFLVSFIFVKKKGFTL
jgi:hypothetical protein